MFGRKKRRRKRLRQQPFPPEWLAALGRNVPYYSVLSQEDRAGLLGHIQVFMAEKSFEGCGGLTLTDEVKITVAAHACILLLHRDANYYPRLCSILVYPGAFVSETHTQRAGGAAIVGHEARVGESWDTGAVIFAWDDVRHSFRHPHDGHNVLFHEFAHQLDQANGEADGFPPIADRALAAAWGSIMQEEYERLLNDVERRRRTVIDSYGAEDPAEFFAVVTECFFEAAIALRDKHPELYELLARFYNQDPARASMSV